MPETNGEAKLKKVITKIHLQNFRKFENATFAFKGGLNILVGNNDQGKSTLLEAVTLALTGRWQGRNFGTELNPHFVNLSATQKYLQQLRAGAGDPVAPPEVIIDLFLEPGDPKVDRLTGTNNYDGQDKPGLRIRAALDEALRDEYRTYVSDPSMVMNVPTEFYRVDWIDFSGNSVNARAVPVGAAMIDASRIRLQSGSDFYLKKIVADALEPKQRVNLSASYRRTQEAFARDPAIAAVNTELDSKRGEVTSGNLTLGVDASQNNHWDNAMTPHLDEVPFSMLGSGEQSKLKIMLALSRRAVDVGVVLVEEPENHLSFSEMNRLIRHIRDNCVEHQLVLATHSSYVINKLGLENLMLVGETGDHGISTLEKDTAHYFEKLSGYDTLRLVLARQVVLVEGPSDELVIQKAYRDRHGRLPIEDGIDVINVRGLSAPRFLNLAIPLERRSVVVTDNDGKLASVQARYAEYDKKDFISICVSDKEDLKTLEPHLVDAIGRELLGSLLDRSFTTDAQAVEWMIKDNNKTDAALAIFESVEKLPMPAYINEALDALSE